MSIFDLLCGKVIEGDYKEYQIWHDADDNLFLKGQQKIALNNETILNYKEVDETKRIPIASMIGKGLLAGFFFGPIGTGLGAASAFMSGSKKRIVQINFKNGKKSLIIISPEVFAKFKFSFEKEKQ